MIDSEVINRANAAKQDHARYLLVCMDLFDFTRGDGGQAYYYPALDSEEAVRARLKDLQAAPGWSTQATRDVCFAVIDLKDWTGSLPDDRTALEPAQWLARHKG